MTDGENPSAASRTFLVESATPEGSCEPDRYTRCLGESRFAVRVSRAGEHGDARSRVVEVGGDESSLFFFFERENWEVLVKVLDGCAANGHVWVFGATATDLGYRISVTDTRTGSEAKYESEPGTPGAAITDTTAFGDACEED